MGLVLDNLILYVKNVTFEDYSALVQELTAKFFTIENEENIVSRYEKLRAREYHYNLQVGNGSGAVYIGYQHNSEKPKGKGFTLKLEVNPAKENEIQIEFQKVFARIFKNHPKMIKGGELALDLPIASDRIFAVSTTGRSQDRHKGTLYYGNRGKHGYLKIYNKKKELEERQKVVIKEEQLTRIEYSFRFPDEVNLQQFSSAELEMDKLYKISIFSKEKLDSFDAVTKALVYSYINGFQDIKEHTYTNKKKIKNAVENMEVISLDHAYQTAKKDILSVIKKFTRL